eukprot:779911-Alexandrium_andersonii.AAC.1
MQGGWDGVLCADRNRVQHALNGNTEPQHDRSVSRSPVRGYERMTLLQRRRAGLIWANPFRRQPSPMAAGADLEE